MDAARILNNRRGISVVYIAILLVALIAIAGLAIDVGYMYVTKSQLQNAADAGALAGAGYYKDELIKSYRTPGYVINTQATRLEAENIAETNVAAAASVQVANGSSNTLSSTNDISMGFWSYSTNNYNDVSPPRVNAVKLRARRTSDSPAGVVNSFFAKVVGFDSFNIQASATAAIPPGAGLYLAMCDLGCSPGCVYPNICTVNPARVLEKPSGSGFDYARALTWTTLTSTPSSASEIGAMVCSNKPYKMVCNQPIYTNTGSINSMFQNLVSVMYNPTVDTSNKDIPSGAVTGWWAILPVLPKDPNDSTKCLMDDNRVVIKYALVHITVICASGNIGGTPPLCTGTASAPAGLCGGSGTYPNDSIVIDRISCIDCNDQFVMPGLQVQLVE